MFVAYRPVQDVAKSVPSFKGVSSRVLLEEFVHLKKTFWGRYCWARGSCAISSRTITDELIQPYLDQ